MNSQNKKLERAKKRVKNIKDFYSHVLVYVLVNIFIAIAHYVVEHRFLPDEDLSGWGYLTTPIGWGIGLLIHGLWVFQVGFGFLRNWEERKINELMKEEKEEFENFKRFE